MANILLMEPDQNEGERMARVLTEHGHSCCLCTALEQGIKCLEQGERTMTVLNTCIPWKESEYFLQMLQDKGLPVIFLAGKAENAAHLRAMYGSDCAVILRGAPEEELAEAVAGLLTTAPSAITLGGITLDLQSRVVSVNGNPTRLTRQEFALLKMLMSRPDTVVTRDDLLRDAWGYAAAGITRTVDVHIQRLRRKLGGQHIETIYRVGYRFAA